MSTVQTASGAAPLRQHTRALIALGVPLIGSQFAQFAIHLTDTIMMGWYGVEELAALTLAAPLFFVLFIVGSGFAFAVMPMASSAAGQGEDRQVRRVTRMGLWISALYAVFGVPVLLSAEPIMLAIGQAPELAALAGQYMTIAGFGLVPGLLTMVLRSYFSALERTQVLLWVTVATAVLNGVINYALIFGNLGAPELGITGAAIGSVFTQVAGLLALIVYAMWKTPEYALFQRLWRPDWEAFGQVFRLGWPIGLTNLAEVGLFSASSVMMGWIGVIELAAHGIALQIASATFMVHIALSQAATIRTGRFHGRGDIAAMRTGAIAAYALSGAMAVLTVIVFLGMPEALIGAFLDPSDPDRPAILAIGVLLLAMAALFQVADAAQVMSLGLLRGIQDTRVPMVMAIVSYWVIGAPTAYVGGFTLGLGPVGIWAGLVLGLSVAALLLALRLRRQVRAPLTA